MLLTTNVEQADYPVAETNHPRCFLDFQINAGEDIGDMYLRPEQFSFSESVSNLFEGQLRLKANDIDKAGETTRPLCFDNIIGQSATVKIGLPNPEYPDPVPEKWTLSDWRFRYFNGIITRFTMAEPGVYTADIKPDLFRLTLANRYHLFGQGEDNSAIDLMTAVKQVLQYHKINFSDNTDKNYNEVLKRTQNWLQTGETDFEFIHRLLDKASVYYYFVHGPTSHQLILSNQASYQPLFEDEKKLRYTFTNEDSLDQDDCVKVYSYNQSLSTSRVKTTLVRSEAAWEEDQEAVYATFKGEKTKSGNVQDDLVFHHYKIFQFSGSDTEANFDAEKTLAKISTAATGLSGKCSSPEFTPVHTFSMTNEPHIYPEKTLKNPPYNQHVRPELEKSPFVITSVHHQVDDSGHYENSFEATESDGFIAQFNIQSTHQGSIIATVWPPPKKGTWKYLEKQDFHWSRQTISNSELARDTSYREPGIWVKFSTCDDGDPPVWVKLAQHMQTVPEVGVTVNITRSNDDSEAPEVSSIVQNNGNMVIMPSGWTANTTVGSSYSTNYGDGKRISYGKNSATDLKSAISIVEDQYNSGEYKDSSYSKGGSYSYSTSEQAKKGLLSRSESFGNTYSTHHGAISDSYSEIDKSTNESKIGESINHSTVGTSTNTSETGTETSDVTTGTRTTTSKTGTETSTSEIGTSSSHAKIGTSTNTSDLGTSISHSKVGTSINTSKTGTSKNTSDTDTGINKSKTGINVNQSKVDTESSVSKVGVSKSNSKIGTSTSHTKIGTSNSTTNITTSISHSNTTTNEVHSDTTTDKTYSKVGKATRKSTVGSEENHSSTGSSNSKSTVGKSVSMSAVGTTTDISAVGNNNSVSARGLSTSISVSGAGVSIDMAGPALSLQLHLLDINMADALHLTM